jgi:DNA-binding transcriptional regulator YhcF (GntR family)
MSRYTDIADALRTRIQSGEFPVGSQLPSIAALQDEYNVRGLNTIRAAQQLLSEEGMVETRQGVGAFVVSTTSLRQVDVVDAITKARDSLTTAIKALTATSHSVTIDLHANDDVHFVLTDALREWGHRQKWEADDEPEEPAKAQRLRWAAVADDLVDRIKAAV